MEIEEWETKWIHSDDNGWYWSSPFDDTGGPYETKESAIYAMRFYGQLMDGGNVKKETLQEALRYSPFKITFTKKDGSERVLRGSLNLDTIKERGWVPDETKESKPSPDHLLNVFDLDINEWRYVALANVTRVE